MNNTLTRIIVSIISIPLILALAYYGGIFFLIFILLIGLISFYEFCKFSESKQVSPLKNTGMAAIFLIIVNSQFHFFSYYELFLIIALVIVFTELFRNQGSAILNIGTTFLGLFYIGLFVSSIVEVRNFFGYSFQGAYLIISIFATIWICDSAAFFGGKALGKHKLFPRVSPNKSWEGAVFGFVFAIATMILAKVIILQFLSWRDVVVIGIIVGLIGQLGDLFESLLKRDAAVKDSSGIIPGHGGIFDRFDSFIAVSPVIYLYLKYFISG
jgi:phosphatidate cytidylyltransferase